jgi:hypothetical protein
MKKKCGNLLNFPTTPNSPEVKPWNQNMTNFREVLYTYYQSSLLQSQLSFQSNLYSTYIIPNVLPDFFHILFSHYFLRCPLFIIINH